MHDIADRYDRVAADFAATIDAVPGDRWAAPSPCEGWTARDVVSHIVDNHRLFEGFVGRSLDDVPPVEADPAAAFAAARRVVSAHLHDPGAAEASFEGQVFGHMTFAEGIDRFLSADLVVHRWDLGRAVGVDVTLPPEEITRLRETADGYGDALRSPGVFGPEVPVPEDADPQARLLAFLGRRA